MGNCCAGNANEGEVSINKGGFKTKAGYKDDYFDNREIAGLRGTEKLRLIIKIQVTNTR
jgi:hypothetical protein